MSQPERLTLRQLIWAWLVLKMRRCLVGVVAVLLAVLAGSCGGGSSSPTAPSTTAPSTTAPAPTRPSMIGGWDGTFRAFGTRTKDIYGVEYEQGFSNECDILLLITSQSGRSFSGTSQITGPGFYCLGTSTVSGTISTTGAVTISALSYPNICTRKIGTGKFSGIVSGKSNLTATGSDTLDCVQCAGVGCLYFKDRRSMSLLLTKR